MVVMRTWLLWLPGCYGYILVEVLSSLLDGELNTVWTVN